MTSGTRRRRSIVAEEPPPGLAVCSFRLRTEATGHEAADFESGRKRFHRNCAQCHGLNMVNLA
jgi:mono/diheme cytochrome c family protein